MTKTVRLLLSSTHPCALMRKKRLLELVPFSKTTLHAKLTEGGRYADPSFPRPIYLPHSRTPFWREAEVLAWIEACALSSRSCEAGEDAVLSPTAVRGIPATADNSRCQAPAPSKLDLDDAPGEVPSARRERFETLIGGQRVVATRRKHRTLTVKSNRSPIEGV